LATSFLGNCTGIFSPEFRTYRISVWSGNYFSGVGRYFKRDAAFDGAGFRYCFHIWYGQPEISGNRVNDPIAGFSDRTYDSEYPNLIQVERIGYT
jgi:hypothetical protein